MVLVLLYNVGVAVNAMEAPVGAPIVWRGRALLGSGHAQAPGQMVGALAPVALLRHARTHYPLVAALLILMAVGVAAICCCCWRWEGHMRLHARLRGHHHTRDHSDSSTHPSSSSSSSTSQEFRSAPPRVCNLSHSLSHTLFSIQFDVNNPVLNLSILHKLPSIGCCM